MDKIATLPGMEGAELDPLDRSQLRSEEAQRIYEVKWGDGGAEWMGDYWTLRAEGWSWRQAAFMVWASLPKDQRIPRTQQALARDELGLASDRVIRKWKQENPAMEVRIRTLTVSALAKARAEIYAALIAAAMNPNPRAHADRKLALEMLGDYVPRQRVTVGAELADDLSEMDAEELRAMAQRPGAGNRDKE